MFYWIEGFFILVNHEEQEGHEVILIIGILYLVVLYFKVFKINIFELAIISFVIFVPFVVKIYSENRKCYNL